MGRAGAANQRIASSDGKITREWNAAGIGFLLAARGILSGSALQS